MGSAFEGWKMRPFMFKHYHLFPSCFFLLVVLGFNATLTANVISWRSVTHMIVFPGFLTPQLGWLVVLGFNATLTAKVISWRSVTHLCFLAFLTPVLTLLFFPKPPTTFLTCFCRGVRRK